MSVTNYTLEKCKYNHSKLKNVLYLVSAEHVKVVHVDTGEAFISGLTELPLRINGFNIQYSEETSLDERYKFDKKITLSMKGYVNYKLFGGRYYAIVEDNDGIYYMVNVDFPSKITHTFNLSQNVNQTDFTFHSLSNFPTIKLDADFEAENLPCLGYNVYGIDSLQLIVSDYARLDTANKKVITTDEWSNIEFLGKSCSLQEVYDGEKVTDTISFQIPLNHKIGWSWSLLEFLDNRYASIILPKGGDNRYFSGFNFGLEPSYSIVSSSNNGESDIITVTLVEMSNHGLTAAVDFEDEDWDTTHWRYVKWVDEIKCYECVGYAKARYLVQQEVDAFGNPTGNYKVKNGYQSQYQMLNVVGTFNNDEQFNDNDCAGDKCLLNTTIPSSIYFSAATCNTYTISASCDWNVSGLAPYVTVTPSTGSADTQYSVTVCNTSSVMGQESTFNINYGSSVKVVNVVLGEPSFINPTIVSIDCLEQDVTFTFDPNCPITVISNPSDLSYQITNSNLIVSVPRNNNEYPVTYYMTVQDCNGDTQLLTINQDKTYVKWVSSGYVCASGNSYVKEVKYTGTTTASYSPTSEYRQGALITSGDTRCQAVKKWEFRNHYYCVDGNKYQCIEEVESYDGENWTPTWETRIGDLVESASSFCLEDVTYEWRLNNRKYQCEGDEPPTPPVPPSEYANQYFTLVAKGNGVFKKYRHSEMFQYSRDEGITWQNASSATTIPVNYGDRIMFKGTLTPVLQEVDGRIQYDKAGIGTFSANTYFEAEGNPMSLLFGDNFRGQTSLVGKNCAFMGLFNYLGSCDDYTYLTSIDNLSLPATTLADFCYYQMFYDCTMLTRVPNNLLPATTLAECCYEFMFNGCSRLTTLPALPATTLARNCYFGMFSGCESLTTVPSNYLPATTLATSCYRYLFSQCSNLTSVPNNLLPATTLADYCYSWMFQDCTSLTSVPNNLLPATTADVGCYEGMFFGCTSLRTAPNLPATNLSGAYWCYSEMFSNCTSLRTSPVLSATTLTRFGYEKMFNGCTSLNYVTCLATNISELRSTNVWLSNVSPTGTFVKASSMSGWPRNESGIPPGWNVQNYNLIERWVNSGTTCSGSSGYDLYYLQARETSNDGGSTWTPTGEKRLGSLIETNSSQCGYVPDCYITSFAFVEGDVCKGSEQVLFNFTVNDSSCTTQQSFNLYDANGRMFTAIVTPSGGSGSGSFATSDMALGTASLSVVVNGTSRTFTKEIIDCGGSGGTYWNTGLPVVVINTPGGQPITSKEVWMEGASIKIYQNRSTVLYESDALSIRGRGNSSWVYSDKKPYALKLNEKSEILGMASSKRWALLANYGDRILMRNQIVNEIAQCTDLSTGMGWSPSGKFVELVLNDVHQGNYYLSEQVRVETNRLDIDDYSDCLYEIDRNDMDEDYTFRSAVKNFPYHIKSPDAPDVTLLKGKIDTIETLLNNGSGYKPYLDYNSFADYWIVEELCQNFEVRGSSPGSVYCYYLADSGVGKLKMGPPWDFDYSTFNLYWPLKANGNYCSGTTVPANGYMTQTLVISCALYYEPLFNDSEFKAVVKQRWNAIKSRLDAILNRFDYWYNTLNASEQLNWALWPIPSTFEPGHHPDYNMTFLDAKNSAKEFYSARLNFLNGVINSF